MKQVQKDIAAAGEIPAMHDARTLFQEKRANDLRRMIPVKARKGGLVYSNDGRPPYLRDGAAWRHTAIIPEMISAVDFLGFPSDNEQKPEYFSWRQFFTAEVNKMTTLYSPPSQRASMLQFFAVQSPAPDTADTFEKLGRFRSTRPGGAICNPICNGSMQLQQAVASGSACRRQLQQAAAACRGSIQLQHAGTACSSKVQIMYIAPIRFWCIHYGHLGLLFWILFAAIWGLLMHRI